MSMGTTGVIQRRKGPGKQWRTILGNCFTDMMSSESAALSSIVDNHFYTGIRTLPKDLRGHFNIGHIDVKKFLELDFGDYDMVLDRLKVPSNSLKGAMVTRLPDEECEYTQLYKVELILELDEYDPDARVVEMLRNLQDSLRHLLYYDYQGSDEYRIVVGFN